MANTNASSIPVHRSLPDYVIHRPHRSGRSSRQCALSGVSPAVLEWVVHRIGVSIAAAYGAAPASVQPTRAGDVGRWRGAGGGAGDGGDTDRAAAGLGLD